MHVVRAPGSSLSDGDRLILSSPSRGVASRTVIECLVDYPLFAMGESTRIDAFGRPFWPIYLRIWFIRNQPYKKILLDKCEVIRWWSRSCHMIR